MPVPSVLTSNGISRIVDLSLIDSEQVALHGEEVHWHSSNHF